MAAKLAVVVQPDGLGGHSGACRATAVHTTAVNTMAFAHYCRIAFAANETVAGITEKRRPDAGLASSHDGVAQW